MDSDISLILYQDWHIAHHQLILAHHMYINILIITKSMYIIFMMHPIILFLNLLAAFHHIITLHIILMHLLTANLKLNIIITIINPHNNLLLL
jgi:hypothetical protein